VKRDGKKGLGRKVKRTERNGRGMQVQSGGVLFQISAITGRKTAKITIF